MGTKKITAEPASENYTILHALVQALQEKDKEKKKSAFSWFRRRG